MHTKQSTTIGRNQNTTLTINRRPHRHGDEARRVGVKVGPVIREPREVFLSDEVIGVFLGRVETIQDHSDEQVQEHKRDGERETGGGNEECTVA